MGEEPLYGKLERHSIFFFPVPPKPQSSPGFNHTLQPHSRPSAHTSGEPRELFGFGEIGEMVAVSQAPSPGEIGEIGEIGESSCQTS